MNRSMICVAAAAAYFASSFAGQLLFAQGSPNDTFRDAVSLVNQHGHVIVLSGAEGGASIAVWPAMQGRVLTSSATGPDGRGFGWVNRDLIESGKVQEHINAVGGEDRLWLGPEGGQFSVFFAHGQPFDLAHWYTPAPIDTEPFDVVRQEKSSITLRKTFHLSNYSGTNFDVEINREVRLLTTPEVWKDLGIEAADNVKVVGFESNNKLTNMAATGWSKTTGVLSLWVLGQFQSTPDSTIILPIRSGPTAELGIPVTTDYFGPVPADRISVRSDSVFFKADSNYRAKLGLSPRRSKGLMGSYDATNHVLTIVQFTQPPNVTEYVNSAWKIQQDPYSGDVANCYNDGIPAPGKPQLGKFFEMESSSPAAALAPHASVEHTQRTIHLVGDSTTLDHIAQATLGVRLAEVVAFHP
ncbi:hypothetical protein ACPOL_7177 (plasmid) [Acidisarcina polymorpha]|uniref:Lipoprotein n=1 Tax=Acidisarcina polymorpha TaxID=2211140 RepID=A0A2Z5GC45_9BACT|nr:DUF6786 family protein [Acidisarcina polymorpha]AXC16367.1 hypothetical protein ACPOL_7177 [Acidisarcina polymorpha]